MDSLVFFNSMTRKKENFVPLKKGEVTLYTCGPTIYHFAHIGNFRTFLFEDLLRRVLQYFGYKVTQAMNLTDVDDKTIRGAIKNKSSLSAFTEPYKKAFFEDLATLFVEKVEYYPEATAYIPEMIALIQTLLDKGVAYKGEDGSLYFSIHKFPSYGALAHLELQHLKQGASDRLQGDEYDKESAADFVLWKNYDPERDGEIFWESPFGRGRPGWHIECSAMSMKLLGETIDIHVGAVDNLFPHHENEIAQSECCSGKPFVRVWLHAEHLIVDGKKMSKSLGNFYTLRDLLAKGYTGREIRFALLHSHYRTPLNFSLHSLDAARQSLARLRDFIVRLREEKGISKGSELIAFLEKSEELFRKSLADDLNISEALGVLFDLVREVNGRIDHKPLSLEEKEAVFALLERWNKVFGFLPLEDEDAIAPEVQLLMEEREKARINKDWALSDRLRDEIHEKGYLIEDIRGGKARIKRSTL